MGPAGQQPDLDPNTLPHVWLFFSLFLVTMVNTTMQMEIATKIKRKILAL